MNWIPPEAQRIIDRLERHKDIFNLERNELGARLCRIASNGANDALQAGLAADGSKLADLSEDYEAWKARTHPGSPLGILDYEMARWENFLGRPEISTNDAEVVFGVTEQARQEAAWFIEGDPPHRPPRPFWGLTAPAIEESRALLTAVFHAAI